MSRKPIFQRQKLLEKKSQVASKPTPPSSPSPSPQEKARWSPEEEKAKKEKREADANASYVKKAPAKPMLDTASMPPPSLPFPFRKVPYFQIIPT